MPDRTSTITLSVADKFSQPLQQYAAATERATAATEKLSAVGKQGSDAAAKLAKSVEDAARAEQAAAQAADTYGRQQVAAFNEIQQAEKATREQAEQRRRAFLDGLQAMRDGLIVVTGALVGFGVTVNKAFEFGREGAAVTQTTESFERMMQIVGAAPGQLDRLRAAARGTADDLTLMANVQTLLAGTSGPLATAFANAAPQLLEIAKAAQKVNPTLGDTNFLFESIARGIKRSSPLILDNLGIVVKLGPAYEAYATSVGKTTEELSAEEKQIALLNAVLAQGNTLMEQAGGNADSAADSFARASAAATNWANMTKAQFAPAMGELAREFAESAELAVLLQEAVDKGRLTSSEAQRVLALTTFGLRDAADETARLMAMEQEQQSELERGTQLQQRFGMVLDETTPKVIQHSAALSSTAQYYAAMVAAINENAEAMQGLFQNVYSEAEAALRRFNIGQAQRIELEERIALLTGEVTAEELARRDAIGYLTQQLALGKITEEEYLAALDKLASGAWTAREAIAAVGAAIEALPPSGTIREYEVVTHYNETHGSGAGGIDVGAEPGPGVGPIGPPGPNDPMPAPGGQYAAGGRFMVPAGFFNDSFGLRAEQGEEVTVRTPRQQREGTNIGTQTNMGGVTINIYQQPGQSAEALAREISRRIGAGADTYMRVGVGR